jgi:hypothetical protein
MTKAATFKRDVFFGFGWAWLHCYLHFRQLYVVSPYGTTGTKF